MAIDVANMQVGRRKAAQKATSSSSLGQMMPPKRALWWGRKMKRVGGYGCTDRSGKGSSVPDIDGPVEPIVESLDVELGVDDDLFTSLERVKLEFRLRELVGALSHTSLTECHSLSTRYKATPTHHRRHNRLDPARPRPYDHERNDKPREPCTGGQSRRRCCGGEDEPARHVDDGEDKDGPVAAQILISDDGAEDGGHVGGEGEEVLEGRGSRLTFV
ncbi:hypothetical protein BC938DRAFT_482895 [Jimgerdemannia flammicorona]|uniref:Uncharacterized protein n=1 Tax=Jimgerdemannia flammicorona TaxID=994334 RepID=A0A433QD35_9FUNG|nr:hypothetical protein BC938DRAFT_482895 [Jimgerdemannia flammicorona]